MSPIETTTVTASRAVVVALPLPQEGRFPGRKYSSSSSSSLEAATDLDIILIDEEEDLQDTVDEDVEEEEEEEDLDSLSTQDIKVKLVELIPKMMGTSEDFKKVESYVNTLEERYETITTLGFLNLAMAGEWQLLFSTNLAGSNGGGPKPNFRLREQYQRVVTDQLKGTVSNIVTWDLSENGSTTFDASGTFSVQCQYEITQGARMVISDDDEPQNTLQLAKGSSVPNDVEGLVALLHQTMPTELFDPSGHAIDTTYLDADVRIVRMTGPSKLEGVRDIFIRRGSMEINPV